MKIELNVHILCTDELAVNNIIARLNMWLNNITENNIIHRPTRVKHPSQGLIVHCAILFDNLRNAEILQNNISDLWNKPNILNNNILIKSWVKLSKNFDDEIEFKHTGKDSELVNVINRAT